MKMKMKMGLVAVGMVAALGASAFSKSIAYSGVVRRADGKSFERAQNVPMTFRIYDSFKPDTVIWARTIPVRVEKDGRFDVELSDSVGTSALGKGQKVVPLERACANVSGSVVIGQTMAGSEEGRVWSEERGGKREDEFRETLTVYPLVERAAFARCTPKATVKKLQSEMVEVKGNMAVTGDLLVPQNTLLNKTVTLNVGNKTVEVGSPDQPIVLRGGLIGWSNLSGADATASAKNDRARLASLKREKTVTYIMSADYSVTQKTTIPFNVFTRPSTNGTANVDVPAGTSITGIQYF